MKNRTRYRLFAACVPGLEDILLMELERLGIDGRKTVGGVEFSGDLLTLYTTNLWLRTATRILARVGSFPLSSLREARKRFSMYPWEIYLGKAGNVRIRASCHGSRIYHSGALAQRLAEAVADRVGRQVGLVKERAGRDCPLIFARLVNDHCVVSIDTSQEHLHRRGFKKYSVRAPLRENLAAAMLISSGYDGSRPIVDPFCGSGTIVFEAAMIACRIPPGLKRSFAFMQWTTFDRSLWNEVVGRSEAFFKKPAFSIIGIDRDESAVQSAIANAETGGLSDFVSLSQGDFASTLLRAPSIPGIVVTNPPYGKRLKENNGLLEFYGQFGQIFRQGLKGWDITLILPRQAPRLKRSLKLGLRRITTFSNGGLPVALLSSVRKEG